MSVLSRVRSLYRLRRELKWLIHDERANKHPISWSERVRAWRLGFLSVSYLELEIDKHDPRDYVNDLTRYLKLSRLNAPYADVLHDKFLFAEVFRRHRDVMPETFALLRRGRVMPISERERVDSLDGVFGLLSRRGRLAMKGTRGMAGSDFTVLEDRGEDGVLVSGTLRTREEVRKLVGGRREQILMEYVQQAAYAREIFAESANTIRLFTLVDDETGRPFLARAFHRFGGRGSRMMDNVRQGGVAAIVDPDSGRLGAVVRIAASGRPERIERHPDTGAQITGVQVPHWNETVARMLAIAGDHPYLPYVGWDVVVTDDGFRIIEGNSNSGMLATQYHGPLLADPRVRRFFERRGVLKQA